ncbi:alpha/beta hydrolase [Nonomuraea sp. LPB2021202275-12-8]|uniref:alpha/beta hydrolase n=1 Tax=Nonomuraea sp. LPB2021202275-12-8 TaxID=3120159 RepID=UPI00300D93BB
MRAIVCSVGLVLVLTACGGAVSTTEASGAPPSTRAATPSPTPTPTPTKAKVKGPNVSGCFTEEDGRIFTHGEGDLPGVITGTGPVGVVITYERGGNVCTWRPLSDRLVAAGYRVLLYARKSDAPPEDVAQAMARRLGKEKGVERLWLVGGSVGATVSVPVAGRLGARAAGVVALSGAIEAADAAKLEVPLLQIGTENDGYGGARDLQPAHDAATRTPDRQLHIIKTESMHASELFRSSYGPDVLDRIMAFMARHKG